MVTECVGEKFEMMIINITMSPHISAINILVTVWLGELVDDSLRVMCLVERIFNIFEIEFFSKSLILILFQSVIIILAHETYKMELLSTKTQLKSLSTKRTERLWNQIIFFQV